MKKINAFLSSLTIGLCLGLGLVSCKDDEPTPPPRVSFETATMSVTEADGSIAVDVVLDRAYGRDLRIEYTVGGTASDQDQVGTAAADFQISGDHGVIAIPAGATSATIDIEIFNDDEYEEPETIELRITDTNTSDVQIGDIDKIVITITSEDAQLVAAFTATTMTINEDDELEGLIQIPVQLDKPAPADVIVTYTVAGTALDSITGAQEEFPPIYWDYHFNVEEEDFGQLVIPAGEMEGFIEILVYTDLFFEDDETIELTLEPSSGIEVGTNSTMTITIEQQDGKVIALVWPEEKPEGGATDADMDLFLWAGADADNLQVVSVSITEAVDPQLELVFLPKTLTDGMTGEHNTTFGLSYNYYSGTVEPLAFEAHFADFANGEIESVDDRDIYPATYTLNNIHPWTPNDLPAIVQTFRVVDGAYTDISAITVPASGSRMKRQAAPFELKRAPAFKHRLLR